MSFGIRLTRLRNHREIKGEEILRCNEESEISESGMSGWSRTEIEPGSEIEEEFCAVLESIKSEEEKRADIELAGISESGMSGWSQIEIEPESEIEEEFCAGLESIKSEEHENVDIKLSGISESGMSGSSHTDIESESEIEEEFCTAVHSIKSEEERNADVKPATLPDCIQLQRVETRSEYSQSTLQLNDDVCLSLRCRLCATPSNDMLEIFSPLEMTKDILEKIEYALPIMVKETDALPKQICPLCLEELERCYRFRKAVAEAEKRLLVFERLGPIKLEKKERNNESSLPNNAQQGSSESDNVDGPSKTNSDVEMNNDKSTINHRDAPKLRSRSVVSSIYKTRSKNNSVAENFKKRSSDTKDRNTNGGIVFENHPASTCDLKVNMESPDDSTLARSRKPPYQCNRCAKTFKQRYHMIRHSRIHTNRVLRPYKCGICANTYIQKSHLTQHSQIHTDERLWPHKCDVCAKMFTRKSDLIRHSLIHEDERLWPHKCNVRRRSNRNPI